MNIKICANCGKVNAMSPGKFCDDDCLIEFCEENSFNLTNGKAVKKAKEKKEKKEKNPKKEK